VQIVRECKFVLVATFEVAKGSDSSGRFVCNGSKRRESSKKGGNGLGLLAGDFEAKTDRFKKWGHSAEKRPQGKNFVKEGRLRVMVVKIPGGPLITILTRHQRGKNRRGRFKIARGNYSIILKT